MAKPLPLQGNHSTRSSPAWVSHRNSHRNRRVAVAGHFERAERQMSAVVDWQIENAGLPCWLLTVDRTRSALVPAPGPGSPAPLRLALPGKSGSHMAVALAWGDVDEATVTPFHPGHSLALDPSLTPPRPRPAYPGRPPTATVPASVSATATPRPTESQQVLRCWPGRENRRRLAPYSCPTSNWSPGVSLESHARWPVARRPPQRRRLPHQPVRQSRSLRRPRRKSPRSSLRLLRQGPGA